MTSLPPVERIPATPRDALIKTTPITREMAVKMAPRIMRRVVESDGCWIRTTCLNRAGYSGINFTVDGQVKHLLAHRVMYVFAHGPIPDGYTIDHLCGRPSCANPAHLEAVTHRQNVLRSETNPYAVNARAARKRRADA